MAENAIDVYLNDHLAGATFGTSLADQITQLSEGTPLAAVMSELSAEIEEDRQTLLGLMESLGIAKNPVKQATSWIAEKASRPKFSGLTAGGDKQLGLFMALESLRLGVQGKECLWTALQEVQGEYPPVAEADLAGLIARARRQRETLERERIEAGKRVLGAPVSAAH
jgi:hypothetical protein